MGYLNKHHRHLLVQFAKTFSKLGVTERNKNAFSGGSYNIMNATIVGIDYDMSRHTHTITSSEIVDSNSAGSGASFISLDVEVKERGKKNLVKERVNVNIGTLIALPHELNVECLLMMKYNHMSFCFIIQHIHF